MKRKCLIFALPILIGGAATMSAHGASMCVPSLSSYKYTTTDANAANNRGQFTWGGTCTADNTTRTISCTVAPTARGESHCSASGTYPAANWETGGKFCWCRLTDVTSSNGYLAPRSGAWVRNGDNYVSDCTSYCAINCASYARNYRGFRRALFASPGS